MLFYLGYITELVQKSLDTSFIPEEGISVAIPGFERHGHDRMGDNLFFHSRLLTASAPDLGLFGGVHPDKQQPLNPHVTLPL